MQGKSIFYSTMRFFCFDFAKIKTIHFEITMNLLNTFEPPVHIYEMHILKVANGYTDLWE